MEKYEVKVEYRGEISGGYRLKVSILSLGVYIDGFKAYPSKKDDGWFIAPPSTRIGNRYKDVIEFNKAKPLWRDICSNCEEVADAVAKGKEYINASDIPFST